MCEDVKNEFNRRIKVDLRSETYFKKIGNLVFRYNVMLPYRSNRTGKICHDSTSEQQNLNVTILKCLCVLLHAVYEVHSCSQLIVPAYVKFYFPKLNS